MTKAPLAICRIIGLLIVGACVVAAIKWRMDWMRLAAEYRGWEDARPINVPVDFSQPGEIKRPYRQTCDTLHGEVLELLISPNLRLDENPKEFLSDLTGEVVMTTREGRPLLSKQFDRKSFDRRDGIDQPIIIAWLDTFAVGEYSVMIRVDTGAEYLSGKEQRLVARYPLCFHEAFPPMAAGIGCFMAGGVALIVALCILPGLIRHGIRCPLQIQPDVTSPNDLSHES